MGSIRNIARNARRPGYLPVMARKAWRRVREPRGEALRARVWAEQHAVDAAEYGRRLDPGAWAEAKEFRRRTAKANRRRREELERHGIVLGGGNAQFAYFLARHLRPDVVLETGVAAGYSSQAILTALRDNGGGHLFSSDFPYFRIAEPERYVGVLVDDDLKDAWTLHLDGDERNLGQILPRLPGPLELVHYDSDKSRAGRDRFMRRIAPHLAADAVIVMDDIDDNLFFADYVAAQGVPFHVFPRGGVHMGVMGLPTSR